MNKLTQKNAALLNQIFELCGISLEYFSGANRKGELAGVPEKGGGALFLIDFVGVITNKEFILDAESIASSDLSDLLVGSQPSEGADSEAILASCEANLELLRKEAAEAAYSLITTFLNRESLRKKVDEAIGTGNAVDIATARLRLICAEHKTNPAKVAAGCSEKGDLLFVRRNSGPPILKNSIPGKSAPFLWDGGQWATRN